MRTGTPSLGRHQSFGLCLGALPTPAGLVRDTRLPPSIALPRHTHRSSYVCVVLDGSYLEDWRRQHDCRRGSILIHPANTSHANQVGPRGARCVNIELDASGFGDPDLATRLARPSHLRLPPTHAALRGLADALAATDALATHEAVLTLLDTCQDLPVSAGRPRWLGSVIDVLEADLSVSPSLTELAALAGLHPHHLAKAFKESRHETIGALPSAPTPRMGGSGAARTRRIARRNRVALRFLRSSAFHPRFSSPVRHQPGAQASADARLKRESGTRRAEAAAQ